MRPGERKSDGVRREAIARGERGASSIRRRALFLFCVAAALPGAALSQGMADPMRPPAGPAAGVSDPAAAGAPVLQSVLIAPSGSAAIISGEMVRVGQKFGDSVLVKVAETEIVLRGTGGVQVLKLHPGVEKRPSAPAAGAASPRRGKAGQLPAEKAAPRQGER